MKTLTRFVTTFVITASFVSPVFASGEIGTDAETISSEAGVGALQVNIESAPLQGSVPQGATRIEVGTLNISASCDADIKIDSIGLMHVGLGDVSDIASVYLNDGTRRISRGRQFDKHSRKADVRVTSLTIRKCEAVRMKIYFDMSRNAAVASEHGVTIDHASAIMSSAKTVTLIHGDASQRIIATPNQAGSITVNMLPITGPLRYGRKETVARIQLTADAQNDHLLRKITFTNLGDARDMNLLDFTLETKVGKVLSAPALRMRGLEVTLELDPTYILERGRTVVFLVKATINSSQSKKVNFTILEPSDLDAMLYRPTR